MARGLRRFTTPRNALIASAIGVFIIAIAPARLIAWTTWLAAPVELLVAPVQQPLRSLVLWLTRPSTGPEAADPVLAELERQRDIWHRRYLAERETSNNLRERLADAERSRSINPGVSVRLITAPVIGESRAAGGRHLRVRAGTTEGISSSSVAVIRGVNLVGRVRETLPRTSLVLPITERAAGQIQGVVMLDDNTLGPTVLLEPTGDGSLAGRVGEFRETLAITTPRQDQPQPDQPDTASIPSRTAPDQLIGALVRLSDASWPESAQMLVIGRIERAGPMPDQPLRTVVTVTPLFRLDRAAEVTLRCPDLDDQRQSSVLTPDLQRAATVRERSVDAISHDNILTLAASRSIKPIRGHDE